MNDNVEFRLLAQLVGLAVYFLASRMNGKNGEELVCTMATVLIMTSIIIGEWRLEAWFCFGVVLTAIAHLAIRRVFK